MSFWSTVGSVAAGAAKKAGETVREVEALANDYRSESTEFLQQKLNRGTSVQKLAASKVLKERGFGS